MRISDWSSDVCSSDLQLRQFDSNGGNARSFLREAGERDREEARTEGAIDADNALNIRHVRPLRRREAADDAADVIPVATAPLADRSGIGDAHKIGSASCRERGCQ